LVLLVIAGCGDQSTPLARKESEKAWRRVGAWSGRGNQQLETFAIEGWIWRVQWAARHEAAPGRGSLRVAAMSADSGREIAEVTDVRGDDHDTKYLSDLPRRYYLVVTSENVDWSLIVEEPDER
jgi:hypothetical protein